jgi:Fe-S oxidoreductase
VFIDHLSTIVDMRRFLVEQGQIDVQLQDALANLGRYGNSFGKSERARAKWTLGFNPPIKDARKEPVEYVWFLGDYASYNASLTEITRKTADVFQRAGLDFGILYEGERNAGNDVRRVGEEGLFEMLVEQNLKALARSEHEGIITTDPHSYNTLKNEYSAGLNGTPPVFHYAELLDKLFASGDLDRALCCGAGGGRIWMEENDIQERPSEARIREAAELDGVTMFIVACPKDLTMYQDAVKTTGNEDRIAVRDLIHLVHETL